MISNCNACGLGELCGGCDECLYKQYSHEGYILQKLPDKDTIMPNVCNVKSSVYDKEINDWGGYLFALPELGIPFSDEQLTKICTQYGDILIEKFKPWWYRNTQADGQVTLSIVEAYQLRDFLLENLDELAYMMAESKCFDEKICKALAKFQKVYYEDDVKKLKDKIKELEEKLSKESTEVSE